MTKVTVTCHTDGCINAGVPIPVEYDPAYGDWSAICGPCGQQIDDVVEDDGAT